MTIVGAAEGFIVIIDDIGFDVLGEELLGLNELGTDDGSLLVGRWLDGILVGLLLVGRWLDGILVGIDIVGKLDGEENEGIILLGQLVGTPLGIEVGT